MVIKYVAGDGTGDYHADGSGDQATINQALAWAAANPGNEIHLKGPFTYDLTGQVLIGSNTILSGDSTAKLRLNNSCLWNTGIPVIGQLGSGGSYSPGTVTHDVEIRGFEIDNNEANLYHAGTDRIHGHGYYNAIYFQGQSTAPVYNISVHDMKIHDGLGDGLRVNYGKTIKFYNNDCWNLEHSTCYFVEVDGGQAYSNDIQHITNAGVRTDNSRNIEIWNNNLYDWMGTTHAPKGGANGIQIGNQPAANGHTNQTQNISIHDNTITAGGCGICMMDAHGLSKTNAQNVHIYNNSITGSGWTNWVNYFAGISVQNWGSGLNIEYNTIDANYRAAVLFYGAIASGVTAAVKNNNLTNSVKAGTEGGWGIWNKVSSSLSVIAENNYCFNNIAGNYSSVAPLSQATSPISVKLPGSGTTDPDIPPYDPDTGVYIPPVFWLLPDEEDIDYYIPGRTAYINRVPFGWQQMKVDVSKVVAQDKSPSVAGWTLSDMDFEGSEVTLDGWARSIEERDRILAAFYKKGRSTIELGGDYLGWQIRGMGVNHTTDCDLTTDIPSEAAQFSLLFLSDTPYREKTQKKVRSRYVFESSSWNADDCYKGNIVNNPSLEEWIPTQKMDWNSGTTPTGADNEWRTVRWSEELRQAVAVAATGTDNRVMISSDGITWTVPTGLSNATNQNNAWRGLCWCPEWSLWVATAISGTTGYYCMTSPDGVTWTAKATPADQSWGYALWIPPDDTLTTGRVLAFAYSGTNRVMYSDDMCETWTQVASATETNTWLSAAYSPELHKIVAVAYSGSATYRVMTSDDYGATWTNQTSPAQKWTSITYVPAISLFVAVSEDGTQQVMTSPDGATWTLRDTPYHTVTVTEPTGTQEAYESPANTIYSSKAPEYVADNTSLEYTVTLPAIADKLYHLDGVWCTLKSGAVNRIGYCRVTCQYGTGTEEVIKEFTNNTGDYVTYGYQFSKEGAVNTAVTIRFYMKTSDTAYRAYASMFRFTVTPTSTSGGSVTYTRNQWRAVTYAENPGLIIAAAQTGDGDQIMTSTDGVVWTARTEIPAGVWLSTCYAPSLNTAISVGNYGTGTRSMYCDNFNNFFKIAGWTIHSETGTQRSTTANDGLYSLRINGDGVSEEIGETVQELILDPGIRYVLSAYGKVDGLTQGSLRVDIWTGSTVIKELIWSDDCDWTEKNITFSFDVVPEHVYLRARAVGTPNLGSTMRVDSFLIERKSDFEVASTGQALMTTGHVDVIPSVEIRGLKADSAPSTAPTAGKTTIFTTEEGTSYSSLATAYKNDATSLELTVTLPALKGGSQYRIDEVFGQLRTIRAGQTAYLKVTIQMASWNNGAESQIAEWTETSTTFQAKSQEKTNLLSATNETVTLRYYMKSSSSTYRAYATQIGYKITEILNTATIAASPISIYNVADPLKIMKCCNRLYPGFRININSDSTGSLIYSESFLDDTFRDIAYQKVGENIYYSSRRSVKLTAGASLIFYFDCLYPVTGAPFISLFVRDGIPQIEIADNSGTDGAPGTFRSVDGNTSVSLTAAPIERELINSDNLVLKGKTKFYLKITTLSGQTCEFSQMYIYIPLDTMDAERPVIKATGEPNTFSAIVASDGTAKTSAIVTLEYRDQEMLS